MEVTMEKEDLLKMIEEDELGLLSIPPRRVSVTADERLIASFEEINAFVGEHGREPEIGKGIREHQLAVRLKSFREDGEKAEILAEYDRFHLLNVSKKEVSSVKDIFEDDDFGLLGDTDETLFELRHVDSKTQERKTPDLIARRRPCEDFESYEKMFQECQEKLSRGEFKLKKLKSHRQFYEGMFFVLNGIVGLVEKIPKLEVNEQNKPDGRLRIVFENGTESNMLLQSLIKSLQDYDGWLVSKHNASFIETVATEKDKHTGYIYILKSLSKDPKIQSIQNLYKIGFSNVPVEERIRNAAEEPTYLMAPVAIVSTFECYNFNPQKLEQLLHNFFGSACLNMDIFDRNNRRHSPREWFVAPLAVIEKAVELIIAGGIVNYRYDAKREEIVLR
jgi:hypothetical protein